MENTKEIYLVNNKKRNLNKIKYNLLKYKKTYSFLLVMFSLVLADILLIKKFVDLLLIL